MTPSNWIALAIVTFALAINVLPRLYLRQRWRRWRWRRRRDRSARQRQH
jgi:hypothetical protein